MYAPCCCAACPSSTSGHRVSGSPSTAGCSIFCCSSVSSFGVWFVKHCSSATGPNHPSSSPSDRVSGCAAAVIAAPDCPSATSSTVGCLSSWQCEPVPLPEMVTAPSGWLTPSSPGTVAGSATAWHLPGLLLHCFLTLPAGASLAFKPSLRCSKPPTTISCRLKLAP